MEMSQRESDHRIANSLTLTASMLRMQRQASSDHRVRSALTLAEARVGSVARFHAYLHRSGRSETVDLAECLREAFFQMGQGIGLRCHLELMSAEPITMSSDQAMQTLIAVNELALNALKHGYDGNGDGDGYVSVWVDRTHDGRVEIDVADGGHGLPDGFDAEASTGLGMRIVLGIVRKYGGTLTHRSDGGGAGFTLTVPVG